MSLRDLCVSLLFECVHCGSFARRQSLPLCEECADTLQKSLSRVLELGQPVDSGFALYSLNEANYRILKSWKKRRGPLFDQKVLLPIERPAFQAWLLALGREKFSITAIPQTLRRSMALGSSPALVLAMQLAHRLEIPYRKLLASQSSLLQKRQAELNSWDRRLSRMRFAIEAEAESSMPKRVLLVDDFITTGHTTREAARILKRGGVREVYALGLGARSASPSATDATSGLRRNLAC